MNGKKEDFVYLFVGPDIVTQDGLSKKQSILEKIKRHFLPKTIEDFNLDTLYSKQLTLKELQERFLRLPVNAKRRIIVIKEVQELKEDLKEFILVFAKKPLGSIILVLDMDYCDRKDVFAQQVSKYARVCHFREQVRLDAFALSRAIEKKSTEQALRILNQLVQDGEKPERILGGLRFAWERQAANRLETKKRLKLLLNCDIDIKTGKLKPLFALEKLVVGLCSLGKPFG